MYVCTLEEFILVDLDTLLHKVEDAWKNVGLYTLAIKGMRNVRIALVAFWVTNPCRITRKVKQTKMYVCTLEEFILVDLDTLLCKLEVSMN